MSQHGVTRRMVWDAGTKIALNGKFADASIKDITYLCSLYRVDVTGPQKPAPEER